MVKEHQHELVIRADEIADALEFQLNLKENSADIDGKHVVYQPKKQLKVKKHFSIISQIVLVKPNMNGLVNLPLSSNLGDYSAYVNSKHQQT